MISIPTRSSRRVDELSFLVRRISTDRTSWIEERSLALSHFLSLTFRTNLILGDISLKSDFFSPFYTLDVWLMLRHVFHLARVPFCPETIYFVLVQVQIILYELYLNYYPTFKIFSKILCLGSIRHSMSQKS